jgi:hypothetical protein
MTSPTLRPAPMNPRPRGGAWLAGLMATALAAACGSDASSSGAGAGTGGADARIVDAANGSGADAQDAAPPPADARAPAADMRAETEPDATPAPDLGPGDATAPTPDAGADAAAPLVPDASMDAAAPPEPDLGPDAAPPPPPPPPPTPVRVLGWPGGGLQMLLELPAEAADVGAWPAVEIARANLPPVPAEMRPALVPTGLTVIVLVPAADPGENLMRRLLADTLITALPPGERVAIMAIGDAPHVLAELTLDRAHAQSQLAHFRAEPDRAAAPHMDALRAAVADLESRFTTPARTLVVLGEAVAETPPGVARPVQTLSRAVVVDFEDDAAALVAELQTRRAALVRVGACPAMPEGEAFGLRAGPTYQVLEAPETLAEQALAPCDAAAAAVDDYPYPKEIAFTFTPEERIVYDERYAAASIEDFATAVALGDATPAPAVAHFHGLGTLGCERKSITVELDGGRRRIAPDLASDRFILISMCQDLKYFGQVFGNRVLAGLGLFAPPFRYVRVRIDGVNQGLYMLVYQTERAFRDASLGLTSVVRRGYDIDAWPAEVKHPSDPELAEATRLRFEAIGDGALGESPDRLVAFLEEHLQFDAYLRWLAVNSLLENGDFIDEAFFAGSDEGSGERFRVSAWDTDDLWSACHADGARAIVDRCGLTYCTEAEVDQALLRSEDVYRRYRRALEDVLATLTPEHLTGIMEAVQTELFGVLDTDETAAAGLEMVRDNPALATLDAQRLDITLTMMRMLEVTETRRAVLRANLDACAE